MISKKQKCIHLTTHQLGCDVVAIAASADGLNAINIVHSHLPHDFPAPIVAEQHLDPRHRSLMAEILSSKTSLLVYQAEKVKPFYLSHPPDRHMLIDSGNTLALTRSELVQFVRPAADLLFESVAASHMDRAIVVVPTCTGSDGSMGMQAIKKMDRPVIGQSMEIAEITGLLQHRGVVLRMEEEPNNEN